MIRALAIGVALSAPAIAEARCHGSWTIGVSSCHHFGTWGDQVAVALGLELTQRALDVGYVESRYSMTRTDAGSVHATGGMIRVTFYAWPHLYLGWDFGVGFFDDALLPASDNLGGVFAEGFLLGTRAHAGPFSFGAELSPEVDVASVGVPGSKALGAILARTRVDLWVTPTLTIGAMIGLDVLDADVSVGVGFAVHPFPYDLTR